MRTTILAALLACPAACAQTCTPHWQGLAVNGEANILYADPLTSDLLVGGVFTSPVPYLARIDAGTLSPVAPGLSGDVLGITRHDDGSGSTLYVTGFVDVPFPGDWNVNYARLQGGAFRSFGATPGPGSWTGHVVSYNLGQGPRLLTTGGFAFPCSYVTQWNGASWECLGDGLGSVVHDSTVFDDGAGPALFCVGSLVVNGAPFNDGIGIAKWTGAAWSTAPHGISGYAEACCVFDDGSGPELFVAGQFARAGGAGGVQASNIAKWNGHRWAALGAGIDRTVTALAVFDDGSGPKLYAAGDFTRAGNASVQRLARWDGHAWSACPAGGLPSGLVNSMRAHDPDGPGPQRTALFVAGAFSSVAGGAVPALNLAVLHPAEPSADFNHDGFIDFFDLDAFTAAFEAGAPAADFNHDSFLDFFDADAFVAAFEAGC